MNHYPKRNNKMAKAWGVKPKNDAQKFALAYLTDASIDLVILEGIAGSGKTLLALSAGLEQVIESKTYKEIIFTRAPVSLGDDMGFLPGEINDKMLPWCGALLDNLEFLNMDEGMVERSIKLTAMQHMRGRSFNKRYIIIDEVQNITPQQIKVLISRAGLDCKIVALGDITQIDKRGLTKENNGLTYLIKAIKDGEDFIQHVKLPDCERSRLAKWAGDSL